jgi:Na+-transporting methylmalonyl-CoA/oxaloacetate decarboxylase beta subunit
VSVASYVLFALVTVLQVAMLRAVTLRGGCRQLRAVSVSVTRGEADNTLVRFPTAVALLALLWKDGATCHMKCFLCRPCLVACVLMHRPTRCGSTVSCRSDDMLIERDK